MDAQEKLRHYAQQTMEALRPCQKEELEYYQIAWKYIQESWQTLQAMFQQRCTLEEVLKDAESRLMEEYSIDSESAQYCYFLNVCKVLVRENGYQHKL